MNARVVGQGEVTMVLSHGYGGSQSIWDNVLPQLGQRYRVVLFDWSFSGAANPAATFDASKYSSLSAFADDLISLLDDMKLKGVVFVGHSMAGMIGCAASVKRPDLFSHLVLIGSSPRYLNTNDYEGGFEMKEVEDLLSDIKTNFSIWAQSFAALVIGVNDPTAIEKFSRTLRMMRPEIALSVAKTVFLSDMRDVLENVLTPCTIVQGTNDIVVPASVSHYMQGKMKGKVCVEIIKMDGHFPQLTCHQVLVAILDRALMTKER